MAIFAVGGLVLAGLWLSPRARPPVVPTGVPPGVPDRPLCFVTCDLRGKRHTVESIVAAVRALRPVGSRAVSSPAASRPTEPGGADYVLLVGVEADEITDLAAGLGMQGSYHPQLFQQAGKARGGKPVGVALLSRDPLYEGRRLATASGPAAGVGAVSVVGGRQFRVACVDLETAAADDSAAALLRWVKEAGATPIIVGGIPGPAEAARVGREAHLEDIGTATSPFLASPEWAAVAAGVTTGTTDGGGVSCTWVLVEPAARRPPPASEPVR